MDSRLYGYKKMKSYHDNTLQRLSLSELESFETFLRKNLYGDVADGMIEYVREVIQNKRIAMSQYSPGTVLGFHFRGV